MAYQTLALALFISLGSLSGTPVFSGQQTLSSSDAQIIYLSDDGGDFYFPYTVDVNGTNLNSIPIQFGDYQLRDFGTMDCSADGLSFVFTDGQVYRIDSDGTDLSMVSYAGVNYGVALSPNDNRIAVAAILIQPWYSGIGAIFVMDADGSNLTKLTQSTTHEDYPTWSPDGQKIAFAYDDDVTRGIAMVNADGSNLVRVTQGTAYDVQPHWSPDGQRIVFTSDRDGFYNIYTMNPDGSGLVQLTQETRDHWYPKWSPDGSLISFSSDPDGSGNEIYRMNADGSNVLRLTTNTYNDINQCWLVSAEPPEPTPEPTTAVPTLTPTRTPTYTPTPSFAANAGPDQQHVMYVEACQLPPCSPPEPIPVTLDGSNSIGAITAYEWTRNGQVVSTQVSFTTYLGPGTHVFTLKVNSASGYATDSVTILVTTCDVGSGSCSALVDPEDPPEQ